jgi:hypothetical protein
MVRKRNLIGSKLDAKTDQPIRKKHKKRLPIFTIIFVILILVGIYFGATVLYKNGLDILKNQKSEAFYTPNETTQDISFKNTYYYTTIDGIKSVNSNGKDINPDANSAISPFIKGMQEPIFQKSEKTVLAFDIRGKSAILFNESGIITTYNFDKQIINAKMNNKGQFVIIFMEDGSKAAVKTFDANGRELLTWFSGTGYVVDAMINDNKNMMSVITNDIVSGTITSKVLFFALDNPEPMSGKIIGDKMCSFVSYYGDNVLAVCDNGLYSISEEGKITLAMDFGDKKVDYFKSFTNGDLLICYGNPNNEMFNVEIFNIKGKKTHSFTVDAFTEITDIAKDKFLVIKRKEIISYNKNGKILKIIPSEFEVKSASYFKDKVAVLGNDRMMIK